MIAIREIGPDDILALSALVIRTYTDAWGSEMSNDELEKHLARRSPKAFHKALLKDIVLVAIDSGTFVGFVQFGAVEMKLPVATHATDREIRSLYVLADRHGQGIGTALLQAALTHPRLSSATSIYLDTSSKNVGAQKFYKRFGFEVINDSDGDVIMARKRHTLSSSK